MRRDRKDEILAAVLLVFIWLFAIGLSWLVTVAVVKLIALCFGLRFNLLHATGVWLTLGLLAAYFKTAERKK